MPIKDSCSEDLKQMSPLLGEDLFPPLTTASDADIFASPTTSVSGSSLSRLLSRKLPLSIFTLAGTCITNAEFMHNLRMYPDIMNVRCLVKCKSLLSNAESDVLRSIKTILTSIRSFATWQLAIDHLGERRFEEYSLGQFSVWAARNDQSEQLDPPPEC